jgi:hypothetical protein
MGYNGNGLRKYTLRVTPYTGEDADRDEGRSVVAGLQSYASDGRRHHCTTKAEIGHGTVIEAYHNTGELNYDMKGLRAVVRGCVWTCGSLFPNMRKALLRSARTSLLDVKPTSCCADSQVII